MNTISLITHESIARRAYQIWEEAGRHDGTDTPHWLQAERELSAQQATSGEINVDRVRSVEPPLSGKHASEQPKHSTNYAHPGVTTDSLHHVRNR
jgi:Protein of unknown function (DUF2934)